MERSVPMSLPDDLPLRPAAEATRRIALDLLDQADAASARLDDAEDAEALHDFRVAVRRLRSIARGHGHHLGEVLTDGKRKRLKALQGLTGGARDAEVQIGHVRRFAEAIEAPGTAAGIEASRKALETQRKAADSGDVAKARRRFAKLERRLREPLSHTTVSLLTEDATYGVVLAGLAREHVAALVDLLASARTVDDAKPLHDARIATKRLRYLLEPARDKAPGATEIVDTTKRLQDRLGQIQDMHVLEGTLKRVVAKAEDEARPGVEALRGAVRAELDTTFALLKGEFLGDALEGFVAAVERFARTLDGARQTETERKYLLDGLPAFLAGEGPAASDTAPAGSSSEELRQGYVPGTKLRERLREVRAGDERKFLRTIKGGSGVQRIEVEETMEPELFERMWPLTEGARVHKRRHTVMDGALEWVVDEFLDRSLVLAEVELPSADVRPPVPEWMAAHLVREVTGEDDFVNLNLAR